MLFSMSHAINVVTYNAVIFPQRNTGHMLTSCHVKTFSITGRSVIAEFPSQNTNNEDQVIEQTVDVPLVSGVLNLI